MSRTLTDESAHRQAEESYRKIVATLATWELVRDSSHIPQVTAHFCNLSILHQQYLLKGAIDLLCSLKANAEIGSERYTISDEWRQALLSPLVVNMSLFNKARHLSDSNRLSGSKSYVSKGVGD